MAGESGLKKIKGVIDRRVIAMEKSHKQKWENMNLKSLEGKLRSLGRIKAPEALKSALLAAIPHRVATESRYYRHRPWQVRNFGAAAAAAAVILALMLVINQGLSISPRMFEAMIDDTSLSSSVWEGNSFFYDDGNTCTEMSMLGELKWPVNNLNVPGH